MSDIPKTDPAVVARLRAAFASEDLVLRAALAKARADFQHGGIKGDVVEVATRSFLRSHLPRKFDVGTGEVIDRYGARSNQLDVIVLNDEQPFVHGLDINGMYLAEGVSAIGEVKSRMGARELSDILAKGERIRTLKPTPLSGDTIHGNPHDIARFVTSFPYFAIALESTMTTQNIVNTLIASGEVDSPDGSGARLPKLDALFVLDRGVFQHFGNGQGSMQLIAPNGTSLPGWASLADESVLVSLFAWLNGVMPRITRAGAIAVPYFVSAASSPSATSQ
jgi:hypothetical protein